MKRVLSVTNYRSWALLVLALFFAGCSTFNHDWKKAAASNAPADGLEGRWDGRWSSDVNGHNDALRCLVTKEAEDVYVARFHAKYRRVLTFGYSVELGVQRTNSIFQFQGDADLGWYAGGLYHYEGQASNSKFSATYRSKYDHGTFELKRPD